MNESNGESKKSNLVNLSTYARRIGVTRQALSRLVASGQIKVVETKGRAKLIDVAQADRARRENRLRFRFDPQADRAFVDAYVQKLRLQTDISALRLARARGDVVDKAETLERAEAIGRSIRKRIDVLIDSADELVDTFRSGGKEAMAELWVKRVGEARADIEAMLAAECAAP